MLTNLRTIRILLSLSSKSSVSATAFNSYCFSDQTDKPIDPEIIHSNQPIQPLKQSSGIQTPIETHVTQKKTSKIFLNKASSMQIRPKPKLIERLNKLNILPQKSLFVGQFKEQEERQEIDIQKTKLTKFQKQKIGLYIPDSPFPVRMTKKVQQQYRQALCERLYSQQKQQFKTSARILELTGNRKQLGNSDLSTCTLEQYVNCVYKDIFARYLVNKGVGVQWLGKYNIYGVMNPGPVRNNPEIQHYQFIQWLLNFMEFYPPEIIKSLYLYSYSAKSYIPLSSQNVEIQDIYKIGHYLTLPLKHFGRHQQNFKDLIERQQQIKLLVFIDDLAKLLDAKCIIIEHGKFIILKRYIAKQIGPEGEENQLEKSQKLQYLITSMEIYSEHRDYFTRCGYEKHTVFVSEHLEGMKAEIDNYYWPNTQPLSLQLYAEIQGYRRKQGLYLCNAQTNLGDWQRSQSYELILDKQPDIIDKQGNILIGNKPCGISITDPKYQEKLIEKLHLDVFPLHGTFQDQIYSYNHKQHEKLEKLHFRRIHRYNIMIPQKNIYELIQFLWGDPETEQSNKPLISESKIVVPKMRKHYPKKRDKRRHLKQIKYFKQQQTAYMSLKESLESVEDIPLNTVQTKVPEQNLQLKASGNIKFPILKCIHKSSGIENPVPLNRQISEILLKNVEINSSSGVSWHLENILGQVKNLLGDAFIEQYDLIIEEVILSREIVNSYKCLKDCVSNSEQISNIMIEPQSKTQETIPNFIHVFYMMKKLLKKQQENSKRKGRKTSHPQKTPKSSNNEQLQKLFSVIKLHPTLVQSQSLKSVNQLLFGVMKLNSKEQYGYGLQGFRLWILKKDKQKGDRTIVEKQINELIKLSSFIRKVYWEILPLVEAGQTDQESRPLQKQYEYDELNYLHRFMADHINYYILNMENAIKNLQLTDAYSLTQDFFKNYVHQIFVKTIRHRIITYPHNHQENQQSKQIIRRIISLLSILQTLIPYSVYHITKQAMLPWPTINIDHTDASDNSIKKLRPEHILKYNRMTKLRVQVRNKLILNKFDHSQMIINEAMIPEYNLVGEDLELFFNVQNISLNEPTQKQKSFAMKMKQHHPLGEKISKMYIYQYKNICFRCSPNYVQKINKRRIKRGLQPEEKYLCSKCLEYLNRNVDRLLPI